MLCDAVHSLVVGSAWRLHSKLGPMINPPSGDLETALKELEAGETWGVMPEQVDNNPSLYSAGLKWGVQPGGYTHMTEFFGPVLGVMRCKNIQHAIELVNQTGYGLTSGLESLDEREQNIWRDGIRAGNLYVNRPTTGAVVQRQPFGGMGKSAFGPGIKAGGPNYVAQLMSFEEEQSLHAESDLSQLDPEMMQLQIDLAEYFSGDKDQCVRLKRMFSSFDLYCRSEILVSHDDVRLVGQDNIRRYRPVEMLRIRVQPEDSDFDVIARVVAAKMVGCRTTVSIPDGLSLDLIDKLDHFTQDWGACIEFVFESDEVLIELVQAKQMDRLRYAHPSRVPTAIHKAAGPLGIFIASAPPLSEACLELLWYVFEQSVSFDYHRYGNLGRRGSEPRREVL
jgi:RHH-type proline utilization regulon transcriptional repressor/proline dehydrogenase/delta 1-pyrroline-5-carboxylate dehydrogenase